MRHQISKQCCGSGMFIPDFESPGSNKNKKGGGGNKFLSYRTFSYCQKIP